MYGNNLKKIRNDPVEPIFKKKKFLEKKRYISPEQK